MAKRLKWKSAEVRKREPVSVRVAGAEARRMPAWLGAAVIIAAVFWVYAPVFHGSWLWDDDWYITNQPLLRNAAGLWKFWFQPGSWIEYYPLEETLLWIEWHLWGSDTLGYHLVTIGLHAGNALLVWRLLDRLGLRKAWLGALIFAVHPAAVDSVAWIAETKTTLAVFPAILGLLAWMDYENSRLPRDYWRTLAWFLIAMLCKISVAPMPAVLLLYVWWKRGRIGWRDAAAVVPFALISVALVLLTVACGNWYYLHHEKLGEDVVLGGFPVRFALAGMALAHYVAHGIWPVQLLPIYPQWKIDPASPWPYPVWLAVLVAAVWAWRCRRGWGRHALLAGGFFLLFLAPFLGFVTVSYLGFTWIMDHLLYLSLIPLAGSFAALLQLVEDRLSLAWRPMVLGITTIVTVLLAFEAHAYTMVYTDQASLWSYTLEHDPDSWLAHYNLGNEYFLSGHYAEAITHYQRALALHPGYIIAHNNLGLAYAQTGRLPEAKAEFEAALRLAPENESARHNLAQAQALLDAAGSKRP